MNLFYLQPPKLQAASAQFAETASALKKKRGVKVEGDKLRMLRDTNRILSAREMETERQFDDHGSAAEAPVL